MKNKSLLFRSCLKRDSVNVFSLGSDAPNTSLSRALLHVLTSAQCHCFWFAQLLVNAEWLPQPGLLHSRSGNLWPQPREREDLKINVCVWMVHTL